MQRKQSEIKKLIRKVRRAKRLGEPTHDWAERIERLDIELAVANIGWKRGVYQLD